ncbi:DHH family phosphoesterase [Candidatus Saccharibacteria bacterium]|nr:DHH family phosphoesterase [Candidatus Saccharibacteria bacterium]
MKIVCTSDAYVDIDGLASMVAYVELLNKTNEPAAAMSEARLNASIPSEMRSWPFDLKMPEPKSDDTFILVDISNPTWIPPWVDENRIEAVIDHHPGYEEYWRERIDGGTQIEMMGAAVTMIWEKWRDSGLLDQVSETSARLIACAILDQTLNFQASVTTDRDRTAYDDCLGRANFDGDLKEWYFSSVQADIEHDLENAIKNDTKSDFKIPSLEPTIKCAQLAVWDGKDFLTKYGRKIVDVLGDDEYWLLNLIDISGGKSQFFTNERMTAKVITELTGAQFDDDGLLAVADRPWLRKEIIKAGIERAKS